MARDKDQMKKEYNEKHGYSNANQFGEISSTDGNGGFADEGTHQPQRQTQGSIRGTSVQQSGNIVNAGSAGKLDRSEREYGGAYELGSGSPYQDTQRYGSVDRRTQESPVEPPVELDSSRIINVATTTQEKQRAAQQKRREREKTGSPKQEVRAVVVDVLKGPDVEATRKRLRYALIGIFRAFDDFINLTLKEKPATPLLIWTSIDDADIDTLVEARISRAQHSVVEARVVKGIITLYEQFATGLITVPRMWQTWVAYNMYGFALPGSEMFPRQRRRRNLRVVENERRDREPESGTTT
jgi:hypothetical protein